MSDAALLCNSFLILAELHNNSPEIISINAVHTPLASLALFLKNRLRLLNMLLYLLLCKQASNEQ